MPILGFTLFREKILDGTKRQTIRLLGKRPKKKGDTLYLYWHLRQKDCESLGKSTCVEAFPIRMHDEFWLGRNRLRLYEPPIDKYEWVPMSIAGADKYEWVPMSIAGADEIARLDGFPDSDAMQAFFVKNCPLPAIFQVIRWGELIHEEKIHNRSKIR